MEPYYLVSGAPQGPGNLTAGEWWQLKWPLLHHQISKPGIAGPSPSPVLLGWAPARLLPHGWIRPRLHWLCSAGLGPGQAVAACLDWAQPGLALHRWVGCTGSSPRTNLAPLIKPKGPKHPCSTPYSSPWCQQTDFGRLCGYYTFTPRQGDHVLEQKRQQQIISIL